MKNLPRYLLSSFIVYFILLLLYLVAAYKPHLRLWGVDWWAYYPGWVPWGLFIIGILVLAGAVFISLRKDIGTMSTDESPGGTGNYLWWSIAVIALAGLLFYFLRVQTHFLGDGYNLLTKYQSGVSLVSFTGWGESLIHIGLRRLLEGDPQKTGLLSFQIISIVSGLGLVAFVFYSARKLFDRVLSRNLFILGLLTGGYMLLFFGYVEYYSCFVMAVGIFTLTGLIVARKIISRWFILPPLALAIFCHLFGLLLLPGALYLLLFKTRFSSWYGKLSRPLRRLVVLLVVIIGGYVAYDYFIENLFFRLSLVPLTANQFTMEGYTLFSLQHLGDIVNLLMVLVPSLPLLLLLLFNVDSFKKLFRQPEYRFLIIFIFFSGLAVIALQPRLGMPRDWDFFSFAGIPLATFFFYALLEFKNNNRERFIIAVLAVSLGVLVLFPRVVALSRPEVIISHFEGYLKQNRKIENEGRAYLIEFYNREGLEEAEKEQRRLWNKENIEGEFINKGMAFYEKGEYYKAVNTLKKAVALNPIYSPIYNNIGKAFIMMKKYDSALYYFNIAYNLNPYNASNNINLGVASFFLKDYERAESAWRRALDLSDTVFSARLYLLQMYSASLQEKKYYEQLKSAGRDEYATKDVVRQLADYYLNQREFDSAVVFYRKALDKGLDSSYIVNLQKEYPTLKVF